MWLLSESQLALWEASRMLVQSLGAYGQDPGALVARAAMVGSVGI